jgi:hypothetical protein
MFAVDFDKIINPTLFSKSTWGSWFVSCRKEKNTVIAFSMYCVLFVI